MTQERLKILEMLAEGQISADQAAQLLAALAEDSEAVEDEPGTARNVVQGHPVDQESTFASAAPEPLLEDGLSQDAAIASVLGISRAAPEDSTSVPPETAEPAPAPEARSTPPDFRKFRSWWTIPLVIGAIVALLSGWGLFLGTLREWNGFWLACLWLPLLLGVFLATLGWVSRTAKWLHVRVDTGQDEWPRRIAISFPIPVRLTAWALRTFGHYIPEEGSKFNAKQLEMIFESMTNALTPEEPLYVEVNEGPGKEKVQVYIG